jgi:hypothetical protein
MNEQALQALKGLAEKLGQRLEVLWPMAVRYVVVEGFVSLATWGFVLPIVTVLLARRGWKKIGDDSDAELSKLCLGLLLAIVGCVSIGAWASYLPQILNPEGYLVVNLLKVKP